jgi:DNA ligase-1
MTTTLNAAPTSAVDLAQNAEKPKGKTAPPVEHLVGARPHTGEPKLDGWRVLIHVAEDGVHFYTRAANPVPASLPDHAAELAENLPAGTWLDTEAVAIKIEDMKVMQTWGSVQSFMSSAGSHGAEHITLMAFDLIAHGGIDARALPYTKRRALLEQVFDGADWNRIQLVPQVAPTQASLDALLAQGFEGMMLKALDAPYASGKRGAGWTKLKPTLDADVIITGYTDGQNGFAGMIGAVEFGLINEDGCLEPAGRCSGMTMKMRQKFTESGDAYIDKVMEIKYQERMPTGGFRSPNFKRMRPDKANADCTWEAIG